MSSNSQNLLILINLVNDERNLKDTTLDGVDRVMAAYSIISDVSSLHNNSKEISRWPELVGSVQLVKAFVDEQRRDPDPVFTPRQADQMASVAAGLQKALGTNKHWQMPSAYIQAFVA